MAGLLRSIVLLALTIVMLIFFNSMPFTQSIKTVGYVITLVVGLLFFGIAFSSYLQSMEQ